MSEDCHAINNDWLVNKEIKEVHRGCLGIPTCPCHKCAEIAFNRQTLADMIWAHGLGVRWTDAGKFED